MNRCREYCVNGSEWNDQLFKVVSEVLLLHEKPLLPHCVEDENNFQIS